MVCKNSIKHYELMYDIPLRNKQQITNKKRTSNLNKLSSCNELAFSLLFLNVSLLEEQCQFVWKVAQLSRRLVESVLPRVLVLEVLP